MEYSALLCISEIREMQYNPVGFQLYKEQRRAEQQASKRHLLSSRLMLADFHE